MDRHDDDISNGGDAGRNRAPDPAPGPAGVAGRGAAEASRVEFWERHYVERRWPWDLAGPAPPLLRGVREWGTPGVSRLAVLGAGRGHDAVALAEAGYEVVGFDFAYLAVQAARVLATERAVDHRARFEQRDLFELRDRAGNDFDIVVEHTCFCAIDPRRRAEYVEVVAALLPAGGLLVGLFFPLGAARRDGPPHATSVEELLALFNGRFEVIAGEIPADSIAERRGRERLMVMRRRQDGTHR